MEAGKFSVWWPAETRRNEGIFNVYIFIISILVEMGTEIKAQSM